MKRGAALAVAAVLLAACTSGPTVDPTGRVQFASLAIEGQPFDVTWYLPAQPSPAAWLLLQPGFTRHCGHLRGTSRRLMATGLTVLCIDAPMAGGAPALATALARQLTSNINGPTGSVLPPAVIVAGHSAGGRFALRLGAELQALAPQRLAGALLFDPVATAGFEADLRAVSADGTRPVLALLAPPHACNAQGNAAPALQAVPGPRVQRLDGGTHADVEGEDSDWIARSACGSPQPEVVARLRDAAVAWVRAVLRRAD